MKGTIIGIAIAFATLATYAKDPIQVPSYEVVMNGLISNDNETQLVIGTYVIATLSALYTAQAADNCPDISINDVEIAASTMARRTVVFAKDPARKKLNVPYTLFAYDLVGKFPVCPSLSQQSKQKNKQSKGEFI